MSAVRIMSKFNSTCKACKGNVKAGEYVFWEPGKKGVVHTECPDLAVDTSKIDVEPQFKLEPARKRKDFPMLFKHQQEVVNTLAKFPDSKLYLAMDPGLGKTLTSIAAASVSESFPLVIVCPSVVKINWQREVKQWIDKEAQILSGRKPYDIESDVVIINYDVLSDWQDTLIGLNPKGIVFDEGHYIKNKKAARSKAALALAKSVDGMRFILSGTPTPNSVYDLVVPLAALDALEKFGGEKNYVKRYCPPVQTRWGVSYARAHNTKELQKNLVNACFVRRRRDDCLDLPEKIRIDVPVEVSVNRDEDVYGDLISKMRKGTLAEAQRVVREMDKMELSDAIATERYNAGMAKIDSIVDIANDIEAPLVIMVHHKEVVSELLDRLKKRKPVKLVGGMTDKARQASVDAFQSGETDLIVASISAAGVGINLQRGEQMIMGELPFTYAEVDQAESRCHRAGDTTGLTVHRVVGIGTFDELIVNIIARKEAVSAAVEDGEEIATVNSQDIIARQLLNAYLTHHGK